VCAFEPDPINFQKAVQQASLNPTLEVKWINAGLAEKAGTAKLSNVNPGNRGMMRILPAQNEIGFQQTNIRLVPLDEWTAQQELQKIDLIKIDVEGYEMSVLKGAVATLSKFNPQLFIELDDDNLRSQGSSAQELLAFLHNHHYTCVHALTGLAISESSNLSHCHFDVMAEKKLSPKSETKS
jgi:FkbM family methyltransferase